jgi:O-antigen/teichoic acid export membrane protein
MHDLKHKTVRGGFAKLGGQAANSALRLAFLIILTRLLDPADFGLVAMVTAVTGVYGLFSSAGLSSATVQAPTITDEQISTLFWINVLIGAIISLLCFATAPMLVAFYREPRLFWVSVAMAAGFLFSAAGVQHSALLQRQLRYIALTMIEALSQLAGIVVGIGMAVGGLGYWALVGAAIVPQATSTVCMWLTAAWIPGKPRRRVGVRSLLQFGGTVTLNGLVVYVAYNLEKVLIGRFWGADALGIYGRAYQLINIPTQTLHGALGGVAFPTLSRLQNEPMRLKNYFLKAYFLVVSMTIPITIFAALFADDIVSVILGSQWVDAAFIFRLLTPTILVFAMIDPTGWLLWSTGQQGRSLRIAMVIVPLVITAYVIGLPYGSSGVAFAYSVAMMLWVVPHIAWCVHNTMISTWDVFRAIGRPFLSGIAAAVFAFGVQHYCQPLLPTARLILGGSVMLSVYLYVLLFILGQKTFYFDLLKGLIGPSFSLKGPDPLS